ncbi:T9SS type A sorting domain-containing protein [Winogradskyella sp. 3972H.M.0a.05]|uniref:T9SS type A sorting domain-containing protein n=1 Tax=Winogradskyella sp. 3972H.M.0a.05 TaxID=2950277 RepID=UPI0033918628
MKCKLLLVLSFVTIYSWSQNWQEVSKIVALDRQTDDQFGYAVAIDGEYAVIGARLEDSDQSGGNLMSQAGAAYVFRRDNDGNWSEVQKIVASDRSSNDEFGTSVDISGDYIIVGAPENVAGTAYIFERTGNVWSEVIKLESSDGENNDLFGFSVAIDGNAAIVGAYNEEEDEFGGNSLDEPGSAYIFERINNSWTQIKKLVASDRDNDDWFGYAVDIQGNHAVIGSHFEDNDSNGNNVLDNSGSVYVFEKMGGSWLETQKLTALDREEDDEFGYSVSIDGNYLIVGAYLEEDDINGNNNLSSSGSAYIYKKDGSSWSQLQKLVPSDRALGDQFGYSVAIRGDYIVIGAYKEDEDSDGLNTLNNAGSAYIFENDTNDVWSETDKIIASDREAQDNFATAVALTEDYIIVGVHFEDEDENGQNSLFSSGSAYIYINDSNLSISNIEQQIGVKLYPNPAQDNVNILGDISGLDSVEFYGLNGQLIKTIKGDFEKISIDDLKASVYIIKLYGDDMSGITLRLIKR